MIPIFNFDTIYEYFTKDNKSIFCYFDNTNRERGVNFTHKNVDWNVLSLDHVNLLLNYNDIDRFIDGDIGSEHYISTILYELSELYNVENINLFHEDWSNFNKINTRLPIFTKNFSDYFIEKVDNLRNNFYLYRDKDYKPVFNLEFSVVDHNKKIFHISSASFFIRKIINDDFLSFIKKYY